MMRFLVVGCGGSGGHTMAYLMDQLRSDLAKDGITRLPAGWQFLFLDVPTEIQAGPEGIGNVVEQGGHYLGLGPRDGSYPALDYALTDRLVSSKGLGAYATWACRRPDAEETLVSTGAGQYRAIGRAVLLNKAREVRDALEVAWKTLEHSDTHAEMERVSAATGGSYGRKMPPLVLVVSSMAGGAGASMALDVCRLFTLVHGTNANQVSLFLLTPDVFDTLRPQARSGVRANALAMLGEIVASQAGAARRSDAELLAAVGLRDTAGARVPFARAFPVGRTVGAEQALFGDGSRDAVYRGLGRGLAGLMTSEVASEQFIAFDLGNRGYIPASPKYLGWGADPAPLPWGSYGFSSISMGRDRYAEYAAQRIGGSAVDRLLDGHLRSGSATSGTAEVQALVASEWNAVCSHLALPSRLAGPHAAAELEGWFATTALPRPEVEGQTARIAEQVLALTSPQVSQAQHWLEHVRRALVVAKPSALQEAEEFAYRRAVDWVFSLRDRIESEVTAAIARYGLVYARALVERIGELLTNSLMPGLKAAGERPVADFATLPIEVENVVAATRGTISGGQDWIAAVLADARLKLGIFIYTTGAGHIARALGDFVPGLLNPLRQALSDGVALLDSARRAPVSHDGLARLETDLYGAWPSEKDQRVPERFGEANNELMLTPSTEFANQFTLDIETCLRRDARGPVPLASVVTHVVSGEWESTGEPAPGGLVRRTVNWWPRAFPVDPSSGQTVRAQEAQYALATRPSDLRARAQAFVRRKDESFDRFVSTSLRAHVEGTGRSQAGELELQRRRRDLVSQFRRALDLAVPLSSVSAQAVKVLHKSAEGGQDVSYRYKFSDIPLKHLPVVEDLQAVITGNSTIDPESQGNLEAALKDSGNPRRIDIFGSYPLYSPLCFNSLLQPVIAQWDRTPPEGAREFWNMRRARPLDASLPMADVERRAMVAGWYIGQLIGEIVLPPEPYTSAVQIWDRSERRWVSFPYPMLTPPSQFRFRQDWLPAVLESSLLAVAGAHQAPVMSSLRPYQLLRELYDADELGGQEGLGLMARAGERRLADWLQDGPAAGRPSRISAVAEAATPEERFAAASGWLNGSKGPATLVAQHFRPGGTTEDGRPGEFADITDRAQAARTPIFRDLADDIVWAVSEVDRLLYRAHQAARPEVSPVSRQRASLPDLDAF